VQIGIYWVNHHYLVDEVETVSHGILWANLMFLFCLSLFPFATDWIGVKGLSSFTTALYAAVSIFPGLGYMALWTQIRSQSAAPRTQVGASRSRPFRFISQRFPWPTTGPLPRWR
jgi:uncharacterized membrane protein